MLPFTLKKVETPIPSSTTTMTVNKIFDVFFIVIPPK
jgi:hypothetical protein